MGCNAAPAFLGNNCILIRALNALTQGPGDHEALRLVTKLGRKIFLEKGLVFIFHFLWGNDLEICEALWS